ncbi:MAG: MFS transporter [Chloroflexi bacterium]|nr:MFS transporter [Chloroflexota bacterium]
MRGVSTRVFYGWFVVMGCSLVALGTAGTQFSFGVFLQPMTEEFGWSRGTLSLAFGITFMLSGLMRPLAGYLADRYNPKLVVLAGVAVLGVMLLVVPSVRTLAQLYAVFAVMSIGLTMGVGPILTKVISAWFFARRGLTLGFYTSAGSLGALILVPAASVFLILFDWRDAYYFLGALALLVILPIGVIFIRNTPQEMGLEPLGGTADLRRRGGAGGEDSTPLFGRDATFRQALGSNLFYRLTFGYFV